MYALIFVGLVVCGFFASDIGKRLSENVQNIWLKKLVYVTPILLLCLIAVILVLLPYFF